MKEPFEGKKNQTFKLDDPTAPNGKREWYVTYDEQGNRDISMQIINEDDYKTIQKKLADPHSTFSNTSSVDLVQNALAESRAEAYATKNSYTDSPENKKATRMLSFLDAFDKAVISDELKSLDALINYRATNPQDQLIALNQKLDEYIKSIELKPDSLDEWTKSFNILEVNVLNKRQKKYIKEDIENLKSKLRENAVKFKEQVELLYHKEPPATLDEVNKLLSAQNRGNESSISDKGHISSLGGFLTDQSRVMCEAGHQITKTMDQRYLGNVLLVNPISKAFHSAGSTLRIKNALYGREHIDTHSASNKQASLPAGEGRLSILPYLPNGADSTVAELDKIICLVSNTPLSQRALSMPEKENSTTFIGKMKPGLLKTAGTSPLYRGLVRSAKFLFLYTAPLLDLALLVPRLVVTPFIAAAYFLPLSDKNKERLDRINNAAGLTFSIVAKKIWHDQYKRLNANGYPLKNAHQELLDNQKQTKITSPFATLFKFYSPKSVANLAATQYTNLFKSNTTSPVSTQPATKETTIQQLSSFSSKAQQRAGVFLRTFRDSRNPADVYAEREEAYDNI